MVLVLIQWKLNLSFLLFIHSFIHVLPRSQRWVCLRGNISDLCSERCEKDPDQSTENTFEEIKTCPDFKETQLLFLRLVPLLLYDSNTFLFSVLPPSPLSWTFIYFWTLLASLSTSTHLTQTFSICLFTGCTFKTQYGQKDMERHLKTHTGKSVLIFHSFPVCCVL